MCPFVVAGAVLFGLKSFGDLKYRREYETATAGAWEACTGCGSILDHDDGDRITLTQALQCIEETVALTVDGVTLDCDNFFISGLLQGVGIVVQNGGRLVNCKVEKFETGIVVMGQGNIIEATSSKDNEEVGIMVSEGAAVELKDVASLRNLRNIVAHSASMSLEGVTACTSRASSDIVVMDELSSIIEVKGPVVCSSGSGCNGEVRYRYCDQCSSKTSFYDVEYIHEQADHFESGFIDRIASWFS